MTSRANKGITEKEKGYMRGMYRAGYSQSEIAAAFGISQVRVSQILREKRK